MSLLYVATSGQVDTQLFLPARFNQRSEPAWVSVQLEFVRLLFWIPILDKAQFLARCEATSRQIYCRNRPHMGRSSDVPQCLPQLRAIGAAEAAMAPGFALIVGMFYRRDEQPLRQGIWFAGNCIANIIGGLVSYGIGHIHSSKTTWRVLFLILVGVTVAYSAVLWAFLPSSPTKAHFLNDREKILSVHRTLESNCSAMDGNDFQTYQMLEAFRDPQAWLLALYTFSVNICNGGITTVSSNSLPKRPLMTES